MPFAELSESLRPLLLVVEDLRERGGLAPTGGFRAPLLVDSVFGADKRRLDAGATALPFDSRDFVASNFTAECAYSARANQIDSSHQRRA